MTEIPPARRKIAREGGGGGGGESDRRLVSTPDTLPKEEKKGLKQVLSEAILKGEKVQLKETEDCFIKYRKRKQHSENCD